MTRVVLVPGVLALLPEYASIEDPVAELRDAVLEAVGSLEGPVGVLGDSQGMRVGAWALEAEGVSTGSTTGGQDLLVVGNGSAKRTTEAPGYLDERAAGFDAELGRALVDGDNQALGAVDVGLAAELWASVEGIVAMGGLPDLGPGETLYADDPFGVQYWVMRWRSSGDAGPDG